MTHENAMTLAINNLIDTGAISGPRARRIEDSKQFDRLLDDVTGPQWKCLCGTVNVCDRMICRSCGEGRPVAPIVFTDPKEEAADRAYWEEMRDLDSRNPLPTSPIEAMASTDTENEPYTPPAYESGTFESTIA